MTESIGSGTAQGVIDYLSSLVEKGRSRSGVIAPLKIALTKVLEKTEGDDWTKVDVIKLDVDDAISRFKNLTLGTYNDASYRAYELRIKRAIGWYKQFLANPGWFPKESGRSLNADVKKPTSGKNTPDANTSVNTKEKDNITKPTTQIPANENEAAKSEAISYPFPLRSGEIARIYMPKSVDKSDVTRLSAFLQALVIEAEK
jgi:hypothetical protein